MACLRTGKIQLGLLEPILYIHNTETGQRKHEYDPVSGLSFLFQAVVHRFDLAESLPGRRRPDIFFEMIS